MRKLGKTPDLLYSDDGIPTQVKRSQTPDEDDDAGDYDAGVEKGHNDDAESTTLKLPATHT